MVDYSTFMDPPRHGLQGIDFNSIYDRGVGIVRRLYDKSTDSSNPSLQHETLDPQPITKSTNPAFQTTYPINIPPGFNPYTYRQYGGESNFFPQPAQSTPIFGPPPSATAPPPPIQQSPSAADSGFGGAQSGAGDQGTMTGGLSENSINGAQTQGTSGGGLGSLIPGFGDQPMDQLPGILGILPGVGGFANAYNAGAYANNLAHANALNDLVYDGQRPVDVGKSVLAGVPLLGGLLGGKSLQDQMHAGLAWNADTGAIAKSNKADPYMDAAENMPGYSGPTTRAEAADLQASHSLGARDDSAAASNDFGGGLGGFNDPGGMGDPGGSDPGYRRGGLLHRAGGGPIFGAGGGLDDAIPATINGAKPAALSDGEYVMPADIVSSMGDGSTNAGVRKLDQIVKQVRLKKYGRSKQPPRLGGLASMGVR